MIANLKINNKSRNKKPHLRRGRGAIPKEVSYRSLGCSSFPFRSVSFRFIPCRNYSWPKPPMCPSLPFESHISFSLSRRGLNFFFSNLPPPPQNIIPHNPLSNKNGDLACSISLTRIRTEPFCPLSPGRGGIFANDPPGIWFYLK